MALCLRPMTAADLAAVLAIERLSFTMPWSRLMFELELRKSDAVTLVAESGDRVVGYICAATVLDEMDLHVLAVDPAHRLRGVGARLLDELIARATLGRVRIIHLEVRESNHAARRLYESRDFLRTGTRRAYYRTPEEDAVLYTRVSGQA